MRRSYVYAVEAFMKILPVEKHNGAGISACSADSGLLWRFGHRADPPRGAS
jgi:hypothetical protein